ncbi:metal ABC transporter substrate-binding protein [Chloroflexota bacterium]
MRKQAILIAVIIIFGLVAGPALSGCAQSEAPVVQVVTSTSHLEYLVKVVGGDLVDVINIVPPASHPGDFDASPGDIQKLADADLFLWHNWPGEVYVPGLIESADNPDLTVTAIEIQGSWMTPSVQLLAVDEVVAALSQVDSQNSAAYQEAAEEYKELVRAEETGIRARLSKANVSEVNVICVGWQAGFVGWAGFNIVATYGLPTPLTLSDIEELVELGREAEVTLVIDNLHDNPDAGRPIADELGCERVILLNFPAVDESTETWEAAVDHNIDLILEALAR